MDLHPEELLEREARGGLSPAESERLELHARQCGVCQLERRARADFRREAEGPDAEADLARILASVVVTSVVYPRPKRPATRYRWLVAAAAAFITVTGLAAASRWSDFRAVPVFVATSAVPPDPMGPALADSVTRHEIAAPPPVPLPSRIVVARRAVVVRTIATRPAADGQEDAAELFRRGNLALRAGDHSRAGELYGALLERYPSSPEAHASLAIHGRMLLDDGNATLALECFTGYLRAGGALQEDVMMERALAFQRLDVPDEEARAWTSLLVTCPSSVHAQRARRRLSALGGP